MLKTILILPDGTELSSGTVGKDAIFSSSLTEQVNNGQELTIGSTCANMLEATIWNPGGRLTINTGDELILYKEEKDGTRHKAGVFVAETPTRPSENSMKITCYDRVPKLDTDLTQWLLSLSGWPYTLLTFAKMVCEQCGLALINEDIPNRSFPVYAYTKAGTTGRMLMQWLGEICARFCRADADGNIEFSWYRPTENIFSATGKYTGEFEPVVQDLGHYYEGGLTYSDYAVGKIEAVQIQLADSADGYLWPETEQGLTHEHIPKLSHNIRAVYRFLHPDGLEEAELEKKAGEHNFYRVIYQHYKKEQEAK